MADVRFDRQYSVVVIFELSVISQQRVKYGWKKVEVRYDKWKK